MKTTITKDEAIERVAVYFLENQGGTTPRKLATDIVNILESLGVTNEFQEPLKHPIQEH